MCEEGPAFCAAFVNEREDELFKQPEGNHLGDCPICFLPFSVDEQKCRMVSCCSKLLCRGCFLYNYKREGEGLKCPFCRQPEPNSLEEATENVKERAEMNDPVAMRIVGDMYAKDGDYDTALDYYMEAADMDDAEANFQVGQMFFYGRGVERDELEAETYYEEAAISGHRRARIALAGFEELNGRPGRATQHLIIAAKLGCKEALVALMMSYKAGMISKDDYAAAPLRGHQATVLATKSPQREEAEAYLEDDESSNLPTYTRAKMYLP